MADIIYYWSTEWRSWVVYCVDAEGNQIDNWPSQCFANKKDLAAGFTYPFPIKNL